MGKLARLGRGICCILIVLFVIPILLSTIAPQATANPSWWDSNWTKRRPITITNAHPANYQLKVDLTYDSDMQSDFDDIRFTEDETSGELDYWIESKIDSDSAKVWVERVQPSTYDSTIYCYYSNPSVGSVGDGDETFLFFDDFPGASLDTDKWTVLVGTPTVNNSLFLDDGESIETKTWTGNTARMRFKVDQPDEYGTTTYIVVGLYSDSLDKGCGYNTYYNWDAYTNDTSALRETISSWAGIHILEVAKNAGTSAKYYIDDVLEHTYNTQVPNMAVPLHFRKSESNELEVDWVFASKYVTPEPTATVGGEEQQFGLGKPTLVSPENSAVISDNTPIFEWNIGTNADNHNLLVDDDSDFSSPTENVWLGATADNYTIATELSPDDYWWKVVATQGWPVENENSSDIWVFEVKRGYVEYNPYYETGEWYKGQLHSHTTNSDGNSSPSAVETEYLQLGFDFIAITDHNYLTPDPNVGGILHLGTEKGWASEEDGGLVPGDRHILAIAIENGIDHTDPDQTRVDSIISQGGLAILAHPVGSGWPQSEMEALENYTGIEIYNAYEDVVGETDGYAVANWDKILALDTRVWGFATDDVHILATQSGKAWITVLMPDGLSTDNILNAIKKGSFYATQGVVIDNIIVSQHSLEVISSGANWITFYGDNGVLLENVTDSSATYYFTGLEKYVRAEVYNTSDDRAWTQPVFVQETPNIVPNPPTSLLCEGQTNPTKITDTTPEFSAIGTDPDGDQMEYYALQVDDDSGFGSPIWNKTKTSITAFDSGSRCSDITYSGSSLARGTTYYWRIKFWDSNDAEGDWSTETATFVLNQLPTVPTNWTNLGMNLVDHTPAISWTKGTDADGDTVTTYVYVGTTSTPTTEETHTTGTSCDLGNTVTLSDGVTYYYRLRSWDGYEWSDYTTSDQFRMNTPPTCSPSVTPTSPCTTDDLVCTPNTSDSEGDSVTCDYQWYEESLVMDAETNSTLDSSKTTSGNNYKCLVTPYDEYEYGAATYSNEVTIGNSSPEIISITSSKSLVDRDLDYAGSDAVLSTTITIRIRDNDGRTELNAARIAVRDALDTVLENQDVWATRTIVDEYQYDVTLTYNPADDLANNQLGSFDVWGYTTDVHDGTDAEWQNSKFTVDDRTSTINFDPTSPYIGWPLTVSGNHSCVVSSRNVDGSWLIDNQYGQFNLGASDSYSKSYMMSGITFGENMSVTIRTRDGVLDGMVTSSYVINENVKFQIEVRFEENYELIPWIPDENRPIEVQFEWEGGVYPYTLTSNPENVITTVGGMGVRTAKIDDNGKYWRRVIPDYSGGYLTFVLVDDPTGVAQFRFFLQDYTTLYNPPDGQLLIKRWVGESLAEINSDVWKADWRCAAWLVEGKQYQVWVAGTDVPLRVVGPIDAIVPSEEKIIVIQSISEDLAFIYEHVSWAAWRLDNSTVRAEYHDDLDNTVEANVKIYDMDGTLVGQFQPDNAWFIITWPEADKDESYNVILSVLHNVYGDFTFSTPVGLAYKPPGVGEGGITELLRMVVPFSAVASIILVICVGLIFDAPRAHLAAIAIALMIIFTWSIGWLPLPGGWYTAILVLTMAVLFALVKGRRRSQ